jgi:hypothetical protein
MKRWLVPFSLICAGCPRAPETNAVIPVDPRAAERAAWLHPTKKDATATRVHPLRAGEALGGPNATGRAGDWVIENDEVVFVIDGLGGGAGFAESGGNLVDAADARTRRDELGQVFTYFGTFPRQAVYTAIDARVSPDGTGIVRARGHELYEASIEVTTEYRLAKSDRALLLVTTLTNRGTKDVTLGLGDAIQWGGTEKVAPGKARGFRGPSRGPFIGAVGRHASYAITTTEGEIAALSGGGWTDTEQVKSITIAPQRSAQYERVFVVGERPDVASIVSELTKASGGETGKLSIALVDAHGASVPAPKGAKAVLGLADVPEVLSIVATRDGTFEGEVPPGRWSVAFAPSVGRKGIGKPVVAEVTKDAIARATLVVDDASSLTIGPCREGEIPIPCKVTIEGLRGTRTPDFGPGHLAGLAKNVVTLRPGESSAVPLPSGDYRITGSRGPEYDLASSEVTLPGASPVAIGLRRVVDTKGYVAADFHQHTVLSADSPVATRDRVLANAAEGVEIAVASEHNMVADLMPIVDELGLGTFLAEVAGDELTSDASREPFGHANVFPVLPRPDQPRNGAPAVRDRLAVDVFADARALPGGPHVLQINHPRSGPNGYFDRLGFDPKTGLGTKPGYDPVFDAIEVWNGRIVAHRTRALADWLALLRVGRPTTPIADTDTHGIVDEEPGYPRTFVRIDADDAFSTRTSAVVRAITSTRDVVLSNGPFMRVEGARIGGLMRPGSIEVKVVTAPWVVVDHAELQFARGGPSRSIALAPKRNAEGAMVAVVRFDVRPKEDDAFIVIVSGTKPMVPVLSGEDADIAPWAMSGPIWVDADGDGHSLGR